MKVNDVCIHQARSIAELAAVDLRTVEFLEAQLALGNVRDIASRIDLVVYLIDRENDLPFLSHWVPERRGMLKTETRCKHISALELGYDE